jgi:hypothetical protein
MDSTHLHSLPLTELKKLAQGRHIKQYYIMKRIDLIRLLALPTLPESFVIDKLTIRQLRTQAKERSLKGFWGLSRGDLVALLYPAPTPLNEEEQNPKEHTPPQKSKSKKNRPQGLE